MADETTFNPGTDVVSTISKSRGELAAYDVQLGQQQSQLQALQQKYFIGKVAPAGTPLLTPLQRQEFYKRQALIQQEKLKSKQFEQQVARAAPQYALPEYKEEAYKEAVSKVQSKIQETQSEADKVQARIDNLRRSLAESRDPRSATQTRDNIEREQDTLNALQQKISSYQEGIAGTKEEAITKTFTGYTEQLGEYAYSRQRDIALAQEQFRAQQIYESKLPETTTETTTYTTTGEGQIILGKGEVGVYDKSGKLVGVESGALQKSFTIEAYMKEVKRLGEVAPSIAYKEEFSGALVSGEEPPGPTYGKVYITPQGKEIIDIAAYIQENKIPITSEIPKIETAKEFKTAIAPYYSDFGITKIPTAPPMSVQIAEEDPITRTLLRFIPNRFKISERETKTGEFFTGLGTDIKKTFGPAVEFYKDIGVRLYEKGVAGIFPEDKEYSFDIAQTSGTMIFNSAKGKFEPSKREVKGLPPKGITEYLPTPKQILETPIPYLGTVAVGPTIIAGTKMTGEFLGGALLGAVGTAEYTSPGSLATQSALARSTKEAQQAYEKRMIPARENIPTFLTAAGITAASFIALPVVETYFAYEGGKKLPEFVAEPTSERAAELILLAGIPGVKGFKALKRELRTPELKIIESIKQKKLVIEGYESLKEKTTASIYEKSGKIESLSPYGRRAAIIPVIRDVYGEIKQVALGKFKSKGIFGAPGGAIEIGEKPLAAAVREFGEELGRDIKIEDLKLLTKAGSKEEITTYYTLDITPTEIKKYSAASDVKKIELFGIEKFEDLTKAERQSRFIRTKLGAQESYDLLGIDYGPKVRIHEAQVLSRIKSLEKINKRIDNLSDVEKVRLLERAKKYLEKRFGGRGLLETLSDREYITDYLLAKEGKLPTISQLTPEPGFKGTMFSASTYDFKSETLKAILGAKAKQLVYKYEKGEFVERYLDISGREIEGIGELKITKRTAKQVQQKQLVYSGAPQRAATEGGILVIRPEYFERGEKLFFLTPPTEAGGEGGFSADYILGYGEKIKKLSILPKSAEPELRYGKLFTDLNIFEKVETYKKQLESKGIVGKKAYYKIASFIQREGEIGKLVPSAKAMSDVIGVSERELGLLSYSSTKYIPTGKTILEGQTVRLIRLKNVKSTPEIQALARSRQKSLKIKQYLKESTDTTGEVSEVSQIKLAKLLAEAKSKVSREKRRPVEYISIPELIRPMKIKESMREETPKKTTKYYELQIPTEKYKQIEEQRTIKEEFFPMEEPRRLRITETGRSMIEKERPRPIPEEPKFTYKYEPLKEFGKPEKIKEPPRITIEKITARVPTKIRRDEDTKRQLKRLVQLYTAQVRRKGKFQAVSEPTTRGAALRRGAEVTRGTLARTFRAIPTGVYAESAEEQSYEVDRRIFRAPKRQTDIPTFIQRATKKEKAIKGGALASIGEIKEIQMLRRKGGINLGLY